MTDENRFCVEVFAYVGKHFFWGGVRQIVSAWMCVYDEAESASQSGQPLAELWINFNILNFVIRIVIGKMCACLYLNTCKNVIERTLCMMMLRWVCVCVCAYKKLSVTLERLTEKYADMLRLSPPMVWGYLLIWTVRTQSHENTIRTRLQIIWIICCCLCVLRDETTPVYVCNLLIKCDHFHSAIRLSVRRVVRCAALRWAGWGRLLALVTVCGVNRNDGNQDLTSDGPKVKEIIHTHSVMYENRMVEVRFNRFPSGAIVVIVWFCTFAVYRLIRKRAGLYLAQSGKVWTHPHWTHCLVVFRRHFFGVFSNLWNQAGSRCTKYNFSYSTIAITVCANLFAILWIKVCSKAMTAIRHSIRYGIVCNGCGGRTTRIRHNPIRSISVCVAYTLYK